MPYQITQTKTRIKSTIIYAYMGYAALGFLAGATSNLLRESGVNPLCPLMAEPECLKRPECQAIYFQDKSFKECVTLSSEQLLLFRKERELCGDSGGRWQRLDVGQYCACSAGKIFINNIGCQ